MQKKAQMSYTKLSLMLIGLTIIWVMCSQAQSQLPQRFEQQLANKLGGTNINKQKLQIAIKIKGSIQKQDSIKATTKMNKLFQQKYSLNQQNQQTICVIVRSFSQQSKGDEDYLTLKSIISQQYKNYHIIYLSENNNQSVAKFKSYLTSNQIHDDKYTFVEGKADVIASLLLASHKCPQNGIVHIIQNGQSLITNKVFKLFNSIFKPEKYVDLIWSNSLYKNNKIGFSVAYPQKAITKKNFRQYQFGANQVNVFRNSLLIQNKKQFVQHTLVNPLWLQQSYMLTLMQKSKNFLYIPEILTIKNKNRKFRSQRTQLEINISELIFKNESIIPLIEKQSKQLNSN